jgi:hypothetical protein
MKTLKTTKSNILISNCVIFIVPSSLFISVSTINLLTLLLISEISRPLFSFTFYLFYTLHP